MATTPTSEICSGWRRHAIISRPAQHFGLGTIVMAQEAARSSHPKTPNSAPPAPTTAQQLQHHSTRPLPPQAHVLGYEAPVQICLGGARCHKTLGALCCHGGRHPWYLTSVGASTVRVPGESAGGMSSKTGQLQCRQCWPGDLRFPQPKGSPQPSGSPQLSGAPQPMGLQQSMGLNKPIGSPYRSPRALRPIDLWSPRNRCVPPDLSSPSDRHNPHNHRKPLQALGSQEPLRSPRSTRSLQPVTLVDLWSIRVRVEVDLGSMLDRCGVRLRST